VLLEPVFPIRATTGRRHVLRHATRRFNVSHAEYLPDRKVRCWTPDQARAYLNAGLIDKFVCNNTPKGWIVSFFTPGYAPRLVALSGAAPHADAPHVFETLQAANDACRRIGFEVPYVTIYPSGADDRSGQLAIGRPAPRKATELDALQEQLSRALAETEALLRRFSRKPGEA
jgi:hypothetical protein